MILHYSDSTILRGFRENNEKCIKYVCTNFLPPVRAYVERNSGNAQDVEDIIQDTLVVLYLQCKNPEFRLTASLKTYFYAIGRNLWLQRLERKHQLSYCSGFAVMEEAGAYSTANSEVNEIDLERMRLFHEHLNSLPRECRMVLNMFSEKWKMAEIAGMMGYKDEECAKSRKYACKNMLVKRIKNDPRFKNLIEYD